MAIVLKSEELKIVKINRITKAKMFEDLKVGDVIRMSIPVKRAGSGGRGTYASNIKIENVATGDYAFKTFNEIGSMLSIFEFEALV